jgi:hypothetical protein
VQIYYQDEAGGPAKRYYLLHDDLWLYDDTYQLQKSSGGRSLQNGDYIQVMCVYNSMERADETLIGLETHDEMCWHRLE